ncbi:Protein BCCIP-like protein [Abeliophyllum distichum]|uniref:Protein BCCIP-like protein n=1 Tax=Abeliophyllum distichum TaxID=126358 RepID=A0ABD1SAP4_9LAMI
MEYTLLLLLFLGRYQDNKCMIELKEYLIKVCQGKDVLAKLRSFMGEHVRDVGLLLSTYVLLFYLSKLIEQLQSSFRFKFYLIISKIYKHKSVDEIKGPSRSKDEAIKYIKPEDEIFHELSSWSFSFSLPTQQVTIIEC